jgi:gluconate 2-dehydrogenase subunit 3-like protein
MSEEITENELTRREMMKLGASAAIAIGAAGWDASVFGQNQPLFFTKEEFALVDELTELIIPADDHSPGAKAALVASYIDFRLSESLEDQPKQIWRDGLKLIEQISNEMHGKPFLSATTDQRIALLSRISQNETTPTKPEEKFFKELKARTARAYYTSKIGIHSEMGYKGNVSLKEFVGYDAT